MITKQVTISSESGVHARPAAMFVKLASTFPCEITIQKDEKNINGKSIMGLMMLALTRGSTITIVADGEREQDAIDSLVNLIEKNFTRDDILG